MNANQTPQNPNRSTQGDVAGTLLEAAAAARTTTTWEIRHGDRWTVRDRQVVVIASNRWPPPEPGTHESDVQAGWASFREYLLPGETLQMDGRGGMAEFINARNWSTANRKENT